MSLLVVLRGKDHLRDPVPIPQVDKDDAAKIAPHVNPTG
jgi:hypothetical protein